MGRRYDALRLTGVPPEPVSRYRRKPVRAFRAFRVKQGRKKGEAGIPGGAKDGRKAVQAFPRGVKDAVLGKKTKMRYDIRKTGILD